MQPLKGRGVTVAAPGRPDDRDRLTGPGASQVADYTAGSVAKQVRASHTDRADALINPFGYTAADMPLDAVRKGGTVATTPAPDQAALNSAGLTGSTIMATPVRETTTAVAEQVASGALKVYLTTVLPLEPAADALATIASGPARGQIVITVG